MQDPGGPQIQDDEICYLCDTQTPSDESPFPRVASCSLCRAGRRGVDDKLTGPRVRATRFVFLFGVRNARPWRRSGGCRRGPRRRYNVNGPRAGAAAPRGGRSLPELNQPAARSVSYSSRTRSIPALTLHRTAFADAASPAFAGSAPLPGQAQYWSRSTRSRRTTQFLL